jgi:predicted acetyltransferase
MSVVAVSVRDARAAPADRLWIQSVYRDYLDDLNPGTGLFPRLGEIGHREPDQIAHWFGDPNTFPLLIMRGDEPVGFARVLRVLVTQEPRIDYRLAEFFIARARRRLGIGQTAVQLILSRFAGRWEITEYLRNAAAVSFWRRVVGGYTQGRYSERVMNGEVHQVFVSGAARSEARSCRSRRHAARAHARTRRRSRAGA